ncbi:MAG TPA: hypothetical protein VGV37_18650 [Aliidongia sp.]|uniref:hypothetical protein n=1 Tax=Aliidongia sp. TaxID=1914230 RepID=UPI002DDCE0B3|nr:hypothetical protein [Aliidongia sp.]HEV2676553.1 hypothetical protein [Aliidongia sp.]
MRNWVNAAVVLVMSAFLVLNPGSADAKSAGSSSSGRSSNGYSRPVSPAPAPQQAAPSSSSSGSSARGYALPGQAPSTTTAAPRPAQSGSDAALSRQASGSALKNYSAQQERAAYAKSAPPAPVTPAFSGYSGRYTSYDSWYSSRSSWYGGMGWGPPVYAYRSYSSFGMWDALFLWFMLDSVSNASHAAWFYNHQQDPGYTDWRREADRLSADNADLRQKLNDLDARTQAMNGQPRDPNYMPPDTKPELALASEHVVAPQPAPSSGHPVLYFVLGMAVVVGGLMLFRRSRLA